MKFKLYENNRGPVKGSSINTLNEKNLEESLYRDIVDLLCIQTKGRGDTTLRIFICNILGLNHAEYDIHHINGHHDDYSLDNIALVPRNSKSNNTIHKTVAALINKSDNAKTLYAQAKQGNQDAEGKLVELLQQQFRTILKNTPGHIIVGDELRKRGLKI